MIIFISLATFIWILIGFGIISAPFASYDAAKWRANEHIRTHKNARYWYNHPDEFEKCFGEPYDPSYNKRRNF